MERKSRVWDSGVLTEKSGDVDTSLGSGLMGLGDGYGAGDVEGEGEGGEMNRNVIREEIRLHQKSRCWERNQETASGCIPSLSVH